MKKLPNPAAENSSRRKFLKAGAMLGGALAACSSPDGGPAPQQSRLGRPVSAYGERSRFEASRRHLPTTQTPEAASTRTPLQDSEGIITPSALHFERHHAGVPELDPAEHRLLIHGLVDRAMIFTVDEIRRLASVSRIHFIECSGNGRAEWGAKTAPDAQRSHGLASCSEWTGVPLKLLLSEAGVKPEAKWLIAEGADACKMQRSLPIEKAVHHLELELKGPAKLVMSFGVEELFEQATGQLTCYWRTKNAGAILAHINNLRTRHKAGGSDT